MLKIQDGDSRHLEKSRYLGNALTDRHEIWHGGCSALPLRTPCHLYREFMMPHIFFLLTYLLGRWRGGATGRELDLG